MGMSDSKYNFENRLHAAAYTLASLNTFYREYEGYSDLTSTETYKFGREFEHKYRVATSSSYSTGSLNRSEWKMGQSVGNLDTARSEISDLTYSNVAANAGYIWAIEDGNNPHFIAVRQSDAVLRGIWTLQGVSASDVESCSCAYVDGVAYLYLADTGDNANARSTIVIHRVVEPTVNGSNGTITSGNIHSITCAFPAGNLPSHKDVEAIMVDPDTGDIYFITKRISPVKLYKLSHAITYTGTQTLEFVTNLTNDATFNTISTTVSGNNGYVTGAAISPNGAEIILRSYSALYYWKRNKSTETIGQCLARVYDKILTDAYVGGGGGAENTASTNPKYFHPEGEPQGEAITFDENGVNLFSCSEWVSGQADVSGSRAVNSLFKYTRSDYGLTVASFQYGVNSYTGCVDTYIDSTTTGAANTTNFGAATSLVMDYDYSTYPTISRTRTALIKWDISSIPTTATVVTAYITFYIGNEGKQFALYKMLQTWDVNTITYSNSGGIALDGVEAASTPSAIFGTTQGTGKALDAYVGFCRVNLPLSLVQGWVSNPSTNFGLLGTGGPTESSGDGVQVESCESAIVSRRPKITISYF